MFFILIFVALKTDAQFSILFNDDEFLPTENVTFSHGNMFVVIKNKLLKFNLTTETFDTIGIAPFTFQSNEQGRPNFYFFPDSTYILMVHSDDYFQYIYKSTNLGQTWSIKYYNSLGVSETLMMFNKNDGCIINYGGGFSITNDGLNSITPYNTSIIYSAENSDVANDSIAAAYENGTFLLTKDRGQTWMKKVSSKNYHHINRTVFMNKDTFLLCGSFFNNIVTIDPDSSNIVFSKNCGSTFDTIKVPLGGLITYNMKIMNQSEIYALCYSVISQKNLIIKTANFFQSIEVIEIPFADNFDIYTELEFVNDSIAYIAGISKYFLKWNKNHTNVGIHDINNNPQISIYPNPANDFLNISYLLKKNAQTQIQILNSIGQLINEFSNPQTDGKYTFSIDTKLYTKGLYYIKLKVGEDTKQYKVVLQ